jgi:hypothetical protein
MILNSQPNAEDYWDQGGNEKAIFAFLDQHEEACQTNWVCGTDSVRVSYWKKELIEFCADQDAPQQPFASKVENGPQIESIQTEYKDNTIVGHAEVGCSKIDKQRRSVDTII